MGMMPGIQATDQDRHHGKGLDDEQFQRTQEAVVTLKSTMVEA
jgi:hypothetical protein